MWFVQIQLETQGSVILQILLAQNILCIIFEKERN